MQKLSYEDIVTIFVGQAVFMLQARFDVLTPKWKDYFARELIRWLTTHLTRRVPDRAKSAVKKSSSVAPRKSTRRGR